MIPDEQKNKLVSSLRNHTVSSQKNNQKSTIPIVIGNVLDEGSYVTYSGNSGNNTELTGKRINIINSKRYRYDDKWYYYKYSVDNPEYTFGILEVDNLPFRSFANRRDKKSFIARLDRLVLQGYIEPFMLFINYEFVKWDDIDVVYDSDDTWLLVHGDKYNYHNLKFADVYIVILPFKCDYIGEESDISFDLNYLALCNYLQETAEVKENSTLYLAVPTLETEWQYKNMLFNVGGWLYAQIKKYYLGMLSNERVQKLKNITVYKYIRNEIGDIISSYVTRFNGLDRDVYSSQALFDQMCYMDKDHYTQYPTFRFNNDGLLDNNGSNIISILDESIGFDVTTFNQDKFVSDNSNIDILLFRDNLLVFDSGKFSPLYEVIESINNVFLYKNTETHTITSYVIYNKTTEKVYRNSDSFLNSYMVETAKNYLEGNSNFDNEFIETLMEALDFEFDIHKTYEENIQNSLESIIDYNPSLLNKLYKVSIESISFSGDKVNEGLTYIFSYESRKGIKIPRKRYKDHETYCMVFLNGELYENYSQMIAYPNFFFIPVDNEFNSNDILEVLYFKNINNNEIRFNMTDWVKEQKLTISSENNSFHECSIFEPFIHQEELKIFCHYPESMLHYPTLITESSENIAFNVSYRDSNDVLCINNKAIADDTFVAVSERKFIYQRLYVDQKAYRIEMDKRFRYCDNQKQYLLFVNGRRMTDDSFLVTIPKYTRPFTGIYLYTARFVNPTDRIEIFYLPDEMVDMNLPKANTEYEAELKSNGYFTLDKTELNTPLSKDLYMLFINGKKIPASSIQNIDSNTIRVIHDTNAINYMTVTAITNDSIPEVVDYLHDSLKLSKYDYIIQYIKNRPLGYDELDKMFGHYTQMSDNETDKVWRNVAKIAIINEIIRDFWVTSGYRYNEQPFTYDYDIDEIFTKDSNGNWVLPALDANPEINIIKNEVSILYFESDPPSLLFELGRAVNKFKLLWEYSQRINQDLEIISQDINGIVIDNDAREYEWVENISEDMVLKLSASTGQQVVTAKKELKFVNGIYWGVIDEDSLQYYKRTGGYILLDELLAIIPKNGRIPTMEEQEAMSNNPKSYDIIKEENTIIGGLDYITESTIDEIPDDINMINVDIGSGTVADGSTIDIYYNESNLSALIRRLDKHLLDSADVQLKNYVIGNNNYFVYAAPKRLLYHRTGKQMIEFYLPDPNNEDIVAHCRDEHTTPIYTDGLWDEFNLLNKLYEMNMEYMGEFEFTNDYGYTETYMAWKTNGFFTRLFEDYGIDIHVKINDPDFIDFGLSE